MEEHREGIVAVEVHMEGIVEVVEGSEVEIEVSEGVEGVAIGHADAATRRSQQSTTAIVT
jgi:hypothetical protein